MTPDRFRMVVSTVLIVGVVASASLLIVALGGALAVGWQGSITGVAAPDTVAPSDFTGLLGGLGAFRPVAIAQAGLLVLVATPVIRVAASVVGFALEGDRLYAAITFGVLTILLVSLLGIH